MAFPPLVLPPGFIDDLGGADGGLSGGVAGAIGALGAAVDLLADSLKNIRELLPPIWPPDFNRDLGLPGSLTPPNERTSFQGPATDPSGGRWPGVPGALGTWILSGSIDRLNNSDHSWESRDTEIPATYPLLGPYLVLISGSEYALRFEGTLQGDTRSYYLPSPNISGGPFLIDPEIDDIVEIQARPSSFAPPQDPEEIEEPKRYPPIVPGPPAPAPMPSVVPPRVPSPSPGPGPGPGTPNPNPNTTPQPATTPTTAPFPILPVILPQVTPTTTTQTNADGSRQTAALPGAITTPVGNEKIGGLTVTTNAPQATLAGIAGEVGRIEQKLAKMIGNPNNNMQDTAWGLLIDGIKAVIENLLTGQPASEYILSSSCERLPNGNRIEYSVPIVQTQNRFDAIYTRLDALADLIQTHKDLKQPICRGTQPTGQPVTVNFTQIE